MVRQLSIDFEERRLTLCVVPADDAWDLWLCERQRRLLAAGTLAIDDAIAAWRQGADPMAAMREVIVDRLQRGEIVLPPCGEGAACPSRCGATSGQGDPPPRSIAAG
jgi:hypothetical protein